MINRERSRGSVGIGDHELLATTNEDRQGDGSEETQENQLSMKTSKSELKEESS